MHVIYRRNKRINLFLIKPLSFYITEIPANVANAIAASITEKGCKPQDKLFAVSSVDSSADALNLMKYLRQTKSFASSNENTKRHRKDRSQNDRSHNRHRTNNKWRNKH